MQSDEAETGIKRTRKIELLWMDNLCFLTGSLILPVVPAVLLFGGTIDEIT